VLDRVPGDQSHGCGVLILQLNRFCICLRIELPLKRIVTSSGDEKVVVVRKDDNEVVGSKAKPKQKQSSNKDSHSTDNVEHADAEKAITKYRVIAHASSSAALLRVEPLTGKKHQVLSKLRPSPPLSIFPHMAAILTVFHYSVQNLFNQ
jgi:NMD protein affecting ribosome stability and mRNA decay